MKQENAVLYFWNASCTVCGPLYEKLKVLVETEFLELSLEKINTATNPELRAQYRVFSSPLIVLLLGGKEYLRSSGNVSLHELKQKINRLYQLKYGWYYPLTS